MKMNQRGGMGMVLLIVAGLALFGAFAYNGLGLSNPENREVVKEMVTSNQNATVNTTSAEVGNETAGAVPDNDVAFTLKMANLSTEQRAFLKLRGIEGDEIQVTNAMVTCANTKFGSERVTAIRNGAELSMTEKITLLACYK